jgi:hypothetical protein
MPRLRNEMRRRLSPQMAQGFDSIPPFERGCKAVVPEGPGRIAQRFNAGSDATRLLSPKGTAGNWLVQPSFRDLRRCRPNPSVETLGYCRSSLRDENAELTLAFGFLACRSAQRPALNPVLVAAGPCGFHEAPR